MIALKFENVPYRISEYQFEEFLGDFKPVPRSILLGRLGNGNRTDKVAILFES